MKIGTKAPETAEPKATIEPINSYEMFSADF